MKKLIELEAEAAKNYFLRGSSYFNNDFPDYISFEPILSAVSDCLGNKLFNDYIRSSPDTTSDVNYQFITNKDGRYGWRPLELMHPVLYVSLVNLICTPENWQIIQNRFRDFGNGAVVCCSLPVVSTDNQSNKATQVNYWWVTIEQQSLINSLEFSHLIHTDVADCYGTLYTHSIAWALHEMDEAKKNKNTKNLLGNQIDKHIQAGRYGQTNGISQGSNLMDFVAEIVLGYVDSLITVALKEFKEFKILRYRDDYRIFTNNDFEAEQILKIVSDNLRTVGMRLNSSKTFVSLNVIEGSIKPDKLDALQLQDLGETNATTLQKQLLRLHSFARKHPNSGALKKLLFQFFEKLKKEKIEPEETEPLVAIITDIAFISPQTFPAIAGILSYLLTLQPIETKKQLWDKVCLKMSKVPNNGYLEIWLQRVTIPKEVNIYFDSDEVICKIVNGEEIELWNNDWISMNSLIKALKVSQIVIKDPKDATEVIEIKELVLFNTVHS